MTIIETWTVRCRATNGTSARTWAQRSTGIAFKHTCTYCDATVRDGGLSWERAARRRHCMAMIGREGIFDANVRMRKGIFLKEDFYRTGAAT